MSDPPRKRGGFRPGAARKPGTGTYGEPTQPLRVPVSLLPSVQAWLTHLAVAPGGGTAQAFTRHPTVLSPLPYGYRIAAGMELVIWGVVAHAIHSFG